MDRADGQLLTQFVTERSESAFEELVGRHGPMVFGACKRMLNDPHDAEDAFQATFLVLARNAAKLRRSDSVASWLHGVALRVGLNAKRQAATRREHEKEARDMIRTESETTWRDLGPVLDEELGRLPERLRAPVVLCYLEDKSTEEAAKELGWSHGTLRGRLAKARDTLRGRLSRRGIAIGAALLASLISKNATAATVPPLCIASTVQAAVTVSAAGALASAGLSAKATALAEAALKAMAWAKVKVAACVVAAGAVVGGGAVVVAREAFIPAENATVAEAEVESPRATAARGRARPSPAVAGRNARPGARIPAAAPAPDPEPETVDPAARKAGAKLRARGLSEAALGSILERYPGAIVDEVERKTRGGRTVYKVDLEFDGRDVEVELGADGTIRRAKEEIDVAAIPQPVANAIARLYPRATVTEGEKETLGDRTVFNLEIRIDGEESDIEIAPDGTVIKDEEAGGQDEDEDEEDEDEVDAEVNDGDEEKDRQKTEGDNARPAAGADREVF